MRDNDIKVLISSRSFGKTGSDAIEILKKQGIQPLVNSTGRNLSEDEIINMAYDAQGIIAGTEKIGEKVINSIGNLKVISRYGVGLDNVDIISAKKRDIKVFNTPGAPTESVAELTVGLILDLMRKISVVDRNIRHNNWKPEMGVQLNNKTVGIIGLGQIGKRVVELLSAFNVAFICYEKKPDEEFIKKYEIKLGKLDFLLKNSDIISIHVPLTNETKNIIGKKEIALMKNTSIIVNTARGGLIDEKSLYDALKNNKIAGAALDVFSEEPYNGKLKELDNTILTAHIGSSTVETRKNMDVESVNNMIIGLKEAGVL